MMKENMPGNGHRQTDGYVDRGPRVLKYRTKGVFTDKVFTVETFDSVSERGRFVQDIRNPHGKDYEDLGVAPPRPTHTQRKASGRDGGWDPEDVYRPEPYGQPGTARRHYTDTLREFFGARIDQLQEAQRWHINSIMKGQSLREAGDELGVSHVAVLKARRRAVEALRGLIGTGNKDVANELVFYLKSEGGVALAGRLPDRVLAESTVWRGHDV